MSSRTSCSGRARVVLLAATALLSTHLPAQSLLHVSTPGARFAPATTKGKVQDVAGGRVVRAGAFDSVILRGELLMPSNRPQIYKLKKLVVHFRTSPQGPSLRAIEIRNGQFAAFRVETHLVGDYLRRETLKPKEAANAWEFRDVPVRVSMHSAVRLEVTFPGGFEGIANTGEFFLASVDADFE